MWVSIQAYVIEDNKQLILEGQLHVALQTIGKEASSLNSKEVQQTYTHKHKNSVFLSLYESVITVQWSETTIWLLCYITCFFPKNKLKTLT